MSPEVVRSPVMAESNLGPADDDIGNRPEPELVARGHHAMLARQAATAFGDADGIAARHLGITRACRPGVSIARTCP